jgi:hypothetical protein
MQNNEALARKAVGNIVKIMAIKWAVIIAVNHVVRKALAE